MIPALQPPTNSGTNQTSFATHTPSAKHPTVEAHSDISPYVEVCFSVTGRIIPVDHGYPLFAAISHRLPDLHSAQDISIQLVSGISDRQGQLHLNDRSKFRIRLPIHKVPSVYSLAGKSLKIGKHTIRLGIPEIQFLQPSETLRSRIVTIKRYQHLEEFLPAAHRKLEHLGITANVHVPNKVNGCPDRRTIRVRGRVVVGFGLEVSHLSEEDSLKLQRYGLGGKRKMGCGVFVPVKAR